MFKQEVSANTDLYYQPFANFYQGYFKDEKKIFSILGLAEKSGIIIDYQLVSKQLSPYLIGKDSLADINNHNDKLPIAVNKAISRYGKTNFSFFVDLEVELIWQYNIKDYFICINSITKPRSSEVSLNESLNFIDLKYNKSTFKSTKINNLCGTNALKLNLAESDYKKIRNARILNGKKTKVRLSFLLKSAKPTVIIPNIMGFRYQGEVSDIAI